jgi:hypothetical protein
MPAAPARKLSSLMVLLGALAVAGCASHPAERELQAAPAKAVPAKAVPVKAVPVEAPVQAAPVKLAPPARRHVRIRIRRPDHALLKPQPVPDCEFKGADSKAVDKDVFARLKLDYERQCYQNAEKVARERLRLLQASSKCEIEPVHRSLIR